MFKIKLNDSGPAKFMYSVIGVCLITCIICFTLYYGNFYKNGKVLWTGVVTFTIMYHFWVRIILGNVSKLFKKKINYKQKWFQELKFEKSLYKLLHVKEWKDKAFTYNPRDFSLKDRSLEDILNTTAKSEVDHWINEAISVSTMFFGLIWGKPWLFIISAICAMIFDSQFIIIQRYNRPRLAKVVQRENRKKETVEV